MINNYNFIIGIDPAGVGSTGIVIWDVKNASIYQYTTINAKSVNEGICMLKKVFDDLINTMSNFKTLVIIENFFLIKGRTITNPLATSEFIGAIISLLKFVYDWNFIKQEPTKKKGFSYQGNIKFTKHEYDAWKHIQYFLNERKTNND